MGTSKSTSNDQGIPPCARTFLSPWYSLRPWLSHPSPLLPHRTVARTAAAMLVRGKLERAEGVTNVVVHKLEELPLGVTARSRDFR